MPEDKGLASSRCFYSGASGHALGRKSSHSEKGQREGFEREPSAQTESARTTRERERGTRARQGRHDDDDDDDESGLPPPDGGLAPRGTTLDDNDAQEKDLLRELGGEGGQRAQPGRARQGAVLWEEDQRHRGVRDVGDELQGEPCERARLPAPGLPDGPHLRERGGHRAPPRGEASCRGLYRFRAVLDRSPGLVEVVAVSGPVRAPLARRGRRSAPAPEPCTNNARHFLVILGFITSFVTRDHPLCLALKIVCRSAQVALLESSLSVLCSGVSLFW